MGELANTIVDSINEPCEISITDTNDHRSYFASFKKIEDVLGFTTDYSIGEGAVEIYNALKNNQISDDIKTKTVEWYKHLLKNPESAKMYSFLKQCCSVYENKVLLTKHFQASQS